MLGLKYRGKTWANERNCGAAMHLPSPIPVPRSSIVGLLLGCIADLMLKADSSRFPDGPKQYSHFYLGILTLTYSFSFFFLWLPKGIEGYPKRSYYECTWLSYKEFTISPLHESSSNPSFCCFSSDGIKSGVTHSFARSLTHSLSLFFFSFNSHSLLPANLDKSRPLSDSGIPSATSKSCLFSFPTHLPPYLL